MREPQENTKVLQFFGTTLHLTHEQANALLGMFSTGGWLVLKQMLEVSQEVDVAGVFLDVQPVMMEGANQAKGSWRLAQALRLQLEDDVKVIAEEFEKELKEKAKRTTGQ